MSRSPEATGASLFLHRDNVKNVTPEDVLRVAKAYLKEDNRTVGVFRPVDAPDRAEIPAVTDKQAALKDFKGSAMRRPGRSVRSFTREHREAIGAQFAGRMA